MFLKGSLHQTDHGRAHLQVAVLATIDPKIDPQINGGFSQAIDQHERLWLAQHGGVFLQHLERDFLGFADGVVITDADIKLVTPIGVRGEVAEIAFINAGIGNLHEIAIQSHEDGGAHVELLHVSDDAGNLSQITRITKGRCMLRKMLARKFSVMSRNAMPTASPTRPVPPTTVSASWVRPETRSTM